MANKRGNAAKKTKPKISHVADRPAENAFDGGLIEDFVSGVRVKPTPEEVEAVQVFSKRLIEDLGYPKSHVQTRPQHRVRIRPSQEGRERGYPVDIAVFASPEKLEDQAYIIVECKRPTRADGERQLKIYLSMSTASLGVWFNGKDHLYLLKKHTRGGELEWIVLPTLPKFGQAVGDIGSLRRGELNVPSNLKAVLRDIRNHLAGNTRGITRDQELAQEIIALLFCKIFDELDKAPEDSVDFRASVSDSPTIVRKRLAAIFERVKREYSDVFRKTDSISLDDDSIKHVVGELQNFAISEATRDAIGDAFEVFIGPAVRGEEGQFFTPRNVVQMVIDLLDPRPGETLVDPACGSGGFLIVALEHMWEKLEADSKRKKWTADALATKKREVAQRCVRGLDKDSFLTRVTKAYMAIIGDGRGGVFCEDALDKPERWAPDAYGKIPLESFDIVVTNPPFGSKIKVTGAQKLSQYHLAHRWKAPRKEGEDWECTDKLHTDQAPQILFIERCIQLLRDGGRMAIVLPEGVFGMPVHGYVVKWLYENYRLRAFISLPEEVFQPYTHAKTCVVVLEKSAPKASDRIEMAIADWCGHDSRGNPTYRATPSGPVLLDDLPEIAKQLRGRLISDD